MHILNNDAYQALVEIKRSISELEAIIQKAEVIEPNVYHGLVIYIINTTASLLAADFKVVTGITLPASTLAINVGATSQLVPTIMPLAALDTKVTYKSSNTAKATVSDTGLVTGIQAGTANITVTTDEGGFTATTAVTVSSVSVTGIVVSPHTAAISNNGTQQMTSTIAPANATNKGITYTTSNAAIATVNSTGLITSTGNISGPVTITATTTDGSFTDTCVATVTVHVTSVTVSPTTTTKAPLGTQQLTPTVLPSGAAVKTVTYLSSNTNVATVNSTGLITAVAAGSATVTVTTTDGSFTATCAVTVTA